MSTWHDFENEVTARGVTEPTLEDLDNFFAYRRAMDAFDGGGKQQFMVARDLLNKPGVRNAIVYDDVLECYMDSFVEYIESPSAQICE
jgi:hypothetical protein